MNINELAEDLRNNTEIDSISRLTTSPTPHKNLESLVKNLEKNFFISNYKNFTDFDKNSKKNSVYSPFVIKYDSKENESNSTFNRKLDFDTANRRLSVEFFLCANKNLEESLNSANRNNNFFSNLIKSNQSDTSNKNFLSPDKQLNQLSSFQNDINSTNINENLFNLNFTQNKTPNNNKFYTPSPNNYIKERRLSDRFIPINKGTNLLQKFELAKKYKEPIIDLDNSFNLYNKNGNNFFSNLINSPSVSDTLNESNSITSHFSNHIEEEKISNNNNNFFRNTEKEDYQKTFYSDLLQSNLFNFSNHINHNENILLDGSSISEKEFTNGAISQGINENHVNHGVRRNSYTSNQEDRKIKNKLFEFKSETYKKTKNSISNVINFKKNFLENLQTSNKFFNSSLCDENSQRKILSKPYRILDAPGLSDDFYLNLLDWSNQNVVAVGLENQVFLWCCKKSQPFNLISYEQLENSELNKHVTSLIWSNTGNEIAIGNSLGETEIWDVNKKQIIRTFTGHTQRIGVIAWSNNIISTGSKDSTILNYDTRSPNIIVKHSAHKQEVCGLKWSFDGTHLASGGNDNKLFIWSLNYNQPIMKSNAHVAAVKALSWSQYQQNILASGGGTADKTIRFWNMNTYQNTSFLETGSQVCNLVFSKNSNELISTHGYSQNQIKLWKLPQMTNIANLTGHSFRVLYLAISPDGQSICTGAGDETMRFWNVFPQAKSVLNKSSLLLSNVQLR